MVSGGRSLSVLLSVMDCPIMRKARFAADEDGDAPDDASATKHTVSRIMITKAVFDIIVELVAAHSHRDGKFKTYRQVIVEGLDIVIRSSVFERFMYLKPYKHDRYRGAIPLFIRFSAHEWKFVQETRALMQEQSGHRLLTQDAIVLAVLAAAHASGVTA